MRIKVHPGGPSSPLGAKFIPGGKLHSLGQTRVVKNWPVQNVIRKGVPEQLHSFDNVSYQVSHFGTFYGHLLAIRVYFSHFGTMQNLAPLYWTLTFAAKRNEWAHLFWWCRAELKTGGSNRRPRVRIGESATFRNHLNDPDRRLKVCGNVFQRFSDSRVFLFRLNFFFNRLFCFAFVLWR
jgi:hypothetical protein